MNNKKLLGRESWCCFCPWGKKKILIIGYISNERKKARLGLIKWNRVENMVSETSFPFFFSFLQLSQFILAKGITLTGYSVILGDCFSHSLPFSLPLSLFSGKKKYP